MSNAMPPTSHSMSLKHWAGLQKRQRSQALKHASIAHTMIYENYENSMILYAQLTAHSLNVTPDVVLHPDDVYSSFCGSHVVSMR